MTRTRRQVGGLAGRAGWTGVDQALSALSNLVVTVVVARSVPARSFGSFALAYATYVVVLGLASALGSEALVMRYSASPIERQRRGIGAATGLALSVGVFASGGSLVAAALVAHVAAEAFIGLALAFPALLLQDCWRFAFFTQGRPRDAAINDLVWCGAEALAFATVLLRPGHHSVFAFVVAWGVGAYAAAAFGMLQSGLRPRPAATIEWVRHHRDLLPQLLADFAMLNGSIQVTFYLVAGVAGLTAVAGLRAAQTLLGPLSVILLASRVFAIPEGVRMRNADYSRLLGATRWFAVILVATASVGCAAIWFLPDRLGHAVLGASWAPARSVLAGMAALTIGRAATLAAAVGLRALDNPRRIMLARALTAPMLVAAGAAGAVAAGARGAVGGLAVAQWVGLCIWWYHLRRAFAEGQPSDARVASTTSISPV